MTKPRLLDQVRDTLRVRHYVSGLKKRMSSGSGDSFSLTTSGIHSKWVSEKLPHF